eukprot:scaffold7339_cov22-Tisochrysis_lutea.AAC.1
MPALLSAARVLDKWPIIAVADTPSRVCLNLPALLRASLFSAGGSTWQSSRHSQPSAGQAWALASS